MPEILNHLGIQAAIRSRVFFRMEPFGQKWERAAKEVAPLGYSSLLKKTLNVSLDKDERGLCLKLRTPVKWGAIQLGLIFSQTTGKVYGKKSGILHHVPRGEVGHKGFQHHALRGKTPKQRYMSGYRRMIKNRTAESYFYDYPNMALDNLGGIPELIKEIKG